MPGKNRWSWIRSIILAIVLALVTRQYVMAFYSVDGNSMSPTLRNGQIIAVNKLVYNYNQPRQGDVIVFLHRESAGNRGRILIKRIIALPGDTLEITDGTVIVNGAPLHETYINTPPAGDYEPISLWEDMLFVMGDNRIPRGSWDSRDFGPIPMNSVLGRASIIVLPIPGKID